MCQEPLAGVQAKRCLSVRLPVMILFLRFAELKSKSRPLGSSLHHLSQVSTSEKAPASAVDTDCLPT